MEIKSNNINSTALQNPQTSSARQDTNESEVKFADELNNLKNDDKGKTEENPKASTEKSSDEKVLAENEEEVGSIDTVNNMSDAIDDLENTVLKLNQSDDKTYSFIKDNENNADNNREGVNLINNDFNIDKDKLPQMLPNMNFGGDGQPFSSFMNNSANEQQDNRSRLTSSAQDLAEEAAILSTMAENIAIANKNLVFGNDSNENSVSAEKIIQNQDGIKKVDTRNDITKEVIVKYDTILMNETDVEVFANLVDGKNININNLTADTIAKSTQVSKTLADLLAKSMEENKPIRIEFDNGISVIIKISRDGKLSADFLPSTQVAEAYLKENLPLLKQRLSEQNLEYDELNQRERRNPDRDQNKKKGQENE